MTGFKRIASTIVAVFVISFLVFSCLVYFQIRQNIADETSSSLEQIRVMVNTNLTAAQIEQVVAQSPHLSVTHFTGRLSQQPSPSQPSAPIVVPVKENHYLLIAADEEAELSQNLTVFWLVAGLFLATLSLLLITLKEAVKQRLQPLEQLSQALEKLAQGEVTTGIHNSDIREFNRVITQFEQLQTALQHKEAQLIKFDQQLAMLQEQERSYLAQELHDNVGQLLTTIKAHAYILVNGSKPSVMATSALKVQQIANDISMAIRHLTAHLHPLVLDRVSLQDSLMRLVHEQELATPDTEWQVSIQLGKFAPQKERDMHLYRFVQEALNNVVKHAQATQVQVSIYGDEFGVDISVVDNGCGLPSELVESMGLASMHSRARCIGAQCSVISNPNGAGVTAHLSLVNTGVLQHREEQVA